MHWRPNPDDRWNDPFNSFPYRGPNNTGCIRFSPRGWH